MRDKFEGPLEGERDGGEGSPRGSGSGPPEEPEACSPSGVDLEPASGAAFARRGRASKMSQKWGGDPAGSGPLEIMRGAVGEDQAGEGGGALGGGGGASGSGGGGPGGEPGGGKGPDPSQQRILF